MPFYKRDGDTLMHAPNFVIGPGFELRAEDHTEHTYPVEGWHWFDTLDLAMAALVTRSGAVVSMRQARLALLQFGMLPAVNAAILALPEPTRTAALIEWDYSSEVHRSWGLVSIMGPALGLTEAQLDALFALAATL